MCTVPVNACQTQTLMRLSPRTIMTIKMARMLFGIAALTAFTVPSWAGTPYPSRQMPAPKDLGALTAQAETSDITITLALKLRHVEAAGQLLEALSNSKSAKYRQFLTPAQFKAQFGASDQDIATLSAQLAAYGLSAARAGASMLRVSGSAANFERAFQVSLHRYQVAAHGHSESFEFQAPAMVPRSNCPKANEAVRQTAMKMRMRMIVSYGLT